MQVELPANTALFEFKSSLVAMEKNATLREEINFDRRADAIDFLQFHLIDPLEELLERSVQADKLLRLKHRAWTLKSELKEVDMQLFQRLRGEIRAGGYAGDRFNNLVSEYFSFHFDFKEPMEEPGYDNMDIFINELISFETMPLPARDLEPDMVYYQKTPARIVFELVEKSQLTKEDVFFDLGSGLGQPAILVNLLTGIASRGIEYDPAFCAYATECARELHLSNVKFLNADARNADYSEGTAFFMFTPFKGEILQEVLALLRKESLQRNIKIITYGPCTTDVAAENWLHSSATDNDNICKLHVFSSY